ncbi:MAG: hypothetical protein KF868_09920 [Acidobacteria bacterium]|nr:hypothetical protein [Acidobacteriota bacterium]
MKLLKHFVIVCAALGAIAYFVMNERVEAKVFGGPPLGFTGAPGEGTCVGCHYTFGVPNPPGSGGSVQISGIPSNYTPGASYTVSVTVAHPTARRWGFALTAITPEGSSTAAGSFTLIDVIRTIKRDSDASGFPRTYITHYTERENSPLSEDGTFPEKPDFNTWSFTWIAPAASSGDVAFYAVGNAANNQVSPEDDYIYTTSFTARAPNTAPVFAALSPRILAPGDRIAFTVSATDAENQPLSYSASALDNSSFDPSTRRFVFEPSSEQTGPQEVTFTVSDGSLDAEITVMLDVVAEGPALLAALDKAGEGSDYLDHASVSGLQLTAIGEFGSGAKVLFNGFELTSQTALLNNPGITAQIPAAELVLPGAYAVRVLLPDGSLTNARTFVLASSINAQSAATVDAAGFRPELAPGQIAAMFGTLLIAGSDNAIADATPLPKSLGNSVVYIDGVAAPLFFASTGQINYQIPYGASSGTAQAVIHRDDGIASQGTIQIADAAPGIFTLNSSGQGQAAALNLDFSPNGDPALGSQFKPVQRDGFIILYAAGTGTDLIDAATMEPFLPVDGVAAPFDRLIATSEIPVVTIGGRTATVTFSGLANGFVGLWQINVRVPADAPTGAAVELAFTYRDRPANTVTIAVE